MITTEIENLKEKLINVEKPKTISKNEIQEKIKDIYNLIISEEIETNVKRKAVSMLINKIIVNEKDMKISLIYNEGPFYD